MSMMVIIILITELFCSGYYEENLNNINMDTSYTSVFFDEFEYNNLLPINIQYEGINTTRNDYLDNFFSQLCYNNFNESKQEISKYSEHSIEELLMDTSYVNVNEDDFNDYMSFLDNIDFPVNNSIYINQPITFKDYYEDLYTNIEEYIKISVNTSSKKYINRLFKIKEIIMLIGGYTFNDKKIVFTPEVDEPLKNKLNNIYSKYENRLIIDEKMYETFSCDLEKEILEFLNDKNYQSSLKRINQQKFHFLLNEFIKFYDYITIIPELLILGFTILTQKNIRNIITVFHLINIFLEQNKENLKKKKIFVLFLIRKTLSYTNRYNIDFFFILRMQETIQTEHINLNFFLSECGYDLRERIKNRKKKRFTEIDRVHYSITLRIILYQHLIFLKYHKIHFNEFKVFTDKVMRSNKFCIGQFEEYINLTFKQCNEFHKNKF